LMNLKVLRLSGFFGILAPIFGLMLIGMSIWLSPWFSWTGNALSDLGGTDGFEAVVFNGGLAMTSALMMMFSVGLFEMTKGDIVGQVGSGVHFLASVLLLAIGLVNITMEPWHTYVSVAFFVTLPLSAIVIGYFCFRKRMRFFTLLGWGTAVLAVVIWLLPWSSVAIPEALSVSYIAVWQVLLSYWMYTRTEDKLEE
jgi:hypothetical membrane protein